MDALARMLGADAMVLSVIAPFAFAAVTALMPGARLAWATACVGAVIAASLTSAAAAQQLFALGAGGADTTLRANGVGLFLSPVLACLAALVLIAADGLRHDALPRAAPIAFAMVLVASGGWMLALYAGDWLALVVGVEIGALASTALAASTSERNRGGLHGAFRFLAAGVFASILLIIGAAMVVRGVGAVELGDLPMAVVRAPGLVVCGVAFVLVAFAIRAGAAPFHVWAGALLGRSSDLAVLTIGVIGAVGAVGLIVRVASYVLPAPAIGEAAAAVLAVLGAASVAIGSTQAIGAVSVRRLGAYAGAAQIGCVFLAAALGSPAGYAAALVLTFAFACAALSYFVAVAAAPGERPYPFDAIDGLGRRAPLAGAAMAAAALSFMGAPLTTGFLGRWQLMEASVGVDWWWAASAGIAASLAGVFYGGRLIERLYFRRIVAIATADGAWRISLIPALVVGIAGVAIAAAPEVLLRLASLAGAAP